MKKHAFPALACLLTLLLCGCGNETPVVQTEATEAAAETTQIQIPETTEATDPYANMTEEEKATAQCRAVLEEVQRGDSYYITLTKWHEGTYDNTVQLEYYRHGNDRAMIGRSTKEDADGQFPKWRGSSVKVCKDGVTYGGYSEDNGSIAWEGQIADSLDFDPWMYTFHWDAQEVEFQERMKTAEGYSISFKVHAQYDITYGFAEDYTIVFYFDEDGTFLERELIATAQEMTPTFRDVNGEWVRIQPDDPQSEKTGRVITRIDHVTVESLDPAEIGRIIDLLWQDAAGEAGSHGSGKLP